MKTIQMYEASDGSRFDSEQAALEHDILVAACNAAMNPLGEKRDIRSEQYVQHTRDNCLQAKRNMMKIIRQRFEGSDYPVFKNTDDAIHPMSFVGRLVNDGCPRCVNNAWHRLMCINWESFREYEQPYFTQHEREATEQLS